MKIYVASSWRNTTQPSVVAALRAAGHDAYDFKNPVEDYDFHWSEIDGGWETWDAEKFKAALSHPIAVYGFNADMDALRACDACVLVMPCGRSAHLEAGFAVGAGKPTIVILESGEPELMYRMFGMENVCTSLDEALGRLEAISAPPGDSSSGDRRYWEAVFEARREIEMMARRDAGLKAAIREAQRRGYTIDESKVVKTDPPIEDWKTCVVGARLEIEVEPNGKCVYIAADSDGEWAFWSFDPSQPEGSQHIEVQRRARRRQVTLAEIEERARLILEARFRAGKDATAPAAGDGEEKTRCSRCDDTGFLRNVWGLHPHTTVGSFCEFCKTGRANKARAVAIREEADAACDAHRRAGEEGRTDA